MHAIPLAGRLPHLAAMALFCCGAACADGQRMPLPDPDLDASTTTRSAPQTAVFAGGCFWGVEAVFEHVKGIVDVTSGYAGGSEASANYDEVSSGSTGHAEAVKILYDPSRITYGQLLKIHFAVAHDPTLRDRQGPDTGPQYRSEIFVVDAGQRRIAEAYIAQLEAQQVFERPIVTRVSELPRFHEAEAYHQDYAARNPNQPYIVIHDRPKVERLKKTFPSHYE